MRNFFLAGVVILGMGMMSEAAHAANHTTDANKQGVVSTVPLPEGYTVVLMTPGLSSEGRDAIRQAVKSSDNLGLETLSASDVRKVMDWEAHSGIKGLTPVLGDIKNEPCPKTVENCVRYTSSSSSHPGYSLNNDGATKNISAEIPQSGFVAAYHVKSGTTYQDVIAVGQ